ncbi:MAG: hypothetical protein U0704_04275 [Candidatus Eisenbacteria bacterium]
MRGDPGLEIVEHVRAAFDPGAEWCALAPRGFTWWPSVWSQRIEADAPRREGGRDVWRVQAELDLLRGVEGTGEAFARMASWNAMHPGLSALRWNGDAKTVSLCATVYVRPGDAEFAGRELATAALLQLADAARDGDALAADLDGELAASAAPGGDLRTEPDALLDGWRQVAEAGAKPSPFTAQRLQAVSAAKGAPWLRVRVDGGGLHAELPCALAGESEPGSAPGANVALAHLLHAQPHPALGAGLLGVLTLPPQAEPVRERVVATAALLNEAEAREHTGVDGTGAWCFHPQAGLAFVTFVPALLDEPARIERLVGALAGRAAWARAFLARIARMRDERPADGAGA